MLDNLSLSNKAVEQIDEADLQALIDNQVIEGKTIDYKRDAIGGTDEKKKEFLADVSSFANASGGYMVIGMDEEKGLPTKLVGIEVADIDVERSRLDQIILSGLQPRMVPSHQIHIVMLKASNRPVIVIRMQKSLTMPHMVTFQNYSRFYSRNSGGKYQLDVGEIRNLFVLSEAQLDRIKRFREERLAKIIADETPVKLMAEARIVLHVIPLSISDPTTVYDLTEFPKGLDVYPIKTRHMNSRQNFDGHLACSQWSRRENMFGYVQFFRNGAIEAVDCELLREREGDTKIIRSVQYEREIVYGLRRYLRALASLKVQPPLLIMISLLGARGYNMVVNPNKYWAESVPIKDGIDRDNLILPEVIVDDYKADVSKLLKPIFDSIWMATGWPGSENYDERGNWTVDEGNYR